jgi:serine/threonine-protein kinase
MDSAFDPTLWSRIETIFDQALELPPKAREAYLDSACEGNERARRQVEDLLAAAAAPGPLDHDLGALAGDLPLWSEEPMNAPGPFLGKSVGNWRILSPLGSGGMGLVFLAERIDASFTQKVALKLLRWEMATPQLVERFEAERQILARFEHPSVARLIDGGLSDDGLPYLAMEYVEGEPIDRACESSGLDLEGRLRLFIQVAEVVQAAHRNLVVHRDLKPSNILVTSDGRIKLLDFGVARIVGEDERSHRLTQVGLAPVTPSCAAPEQLDGSVITTATDVWGLGVLLYLLLTDQQPFASEGPLHELTRRILEENPLLPSRCVDAQRARRLRGDLDTIVLKALQKDPQRRYVSAQRMAEDIESHLNGLPVSAQAPTFSYRAQKALQRHRRSVVFSAAGVLLLVALTAFYTKRLAVQRDRAVAEERKTSQVESFIVSLFEENDPTTSAGEELTARQMLDRGAQRIETELQGQPEIAGEMHEVVAGLYQQLGEYESARDHFADAVTLRRKALGPDAVEVAESLARYGFALQELDDLERAESELRKSVSIWRQHPKNRQGLAAALNNLGMTLSYRGRYDEAESVLQKALELKRFVLGEDDEGYAQTLANLGLTLKWNGELERAEPIYRRVLAIREATLGKESTGYAISLDNLGVLLGQKGEYEEAERCFRDALAIRTKILGEDHPDVAMNLNNLATLYRVQGRLDEAEPIYRKVLRVNTRLHGPRHRTVATNLHNLASLLLSRGKNEEATELLEQALSIRREIYGEGHIDVAMTENSLATALTRGGQATKADTLSSEALAIARKVVGDQSFQLAAVLAGRGRVLLALDRLDAAEPLLREALEIQMKSLAADHWETAETRTLLGACLGAKGDYDGAELLLRKGYERLLDARGSSDVATNEAREALASLYRKWGKPKEAESLELSARTGGADD